MMAGLCVILATLCINVVRWEIQFVQMTAQDSSLTHDQSFWSLIQNSLFPFPFPLFFPPSFSPSLSFSFLLSSFPRSPRPSLRIPPSRPFSCLSHFSIFFQRCVGLAVDHGRLSRWSLHPTFLPFSILNPTHLGFLRSLFYHVTPPSKTVTHSLFPCV